MHVRRYGSAGPLVVLVHGGPGTPGSLAPVARELASRFRVLEPFQRGSGGARLTVARHVDDLEELLAAECAGERAQVAGTSWGAILALAHAARHHEHVASIVLVSCGTLDSAAREVFHERLGARLPPEARERLARLGSEVRDLDERMRAMVELVSPAYSFDRIAGEEIEAIDGRAFEETWNDELLLQAQGVHPAEFAAVGVPVLMIHGAYDPHPGKAIEESLRPWLPQLEYVELERCGHTPWLERHAREAFFLRLIAWLEEHADR